MDKYIYNSPYEISLWDDLNAWEILKDGEILSEIYPLRERRQGVCQ